MALEHYVKFVRGTYDAYNKVTSKDDDTLYFIYNEDTNESALYLGSRKIASAEGDTISESSINALADVLIGEDLADKSLLVYNADQKQWVNTDFEKLVFVGATNEASGVAGFVPAPEIKETNLFLRSDGTWAAIEGIVAETAEQNVINIVNESNKTHAEIIAEAIVDLELAKGNIIIIKDLIVDGVYEHSAYVYDGTEWNALNDGYKANKIFFTEDLDNIPARGQDLVEVLKSIISNLTLSADDVSISLTDNKLSLKSYGTQYYKYIPESGSEENGDYIAAHYELQIVDENNPWIAGLEPRVTSEDGQLVLGWYEQNPTTIDGVNAQVSSLQTSVNDLQQTANELLDLVGAPAEGEVVASGLYAELDKKANAEDVYTKEEVNTQIAAANHLKRKIVEYYEDIQTYIDENEDADQYIFMVPVGVTDYDNKYNEYIVIEGVIEPVGDWSVNLNDYVSRTELNTALVSKVDKIEGGSLFMQADATKLASIEEGAQINKIETVDETQFNLSNKHLTLLDIPITKVTDLEAVLNGKVDKKDGYRLMSEAEATKLATAEENYISSVDEVHFAVANKKLSLLDIPITKVTDLESILNNKADKSDITAVNTGMATLSARVATVEAAIQWTDLSIT